MNRPLAALLDPAMKHEAVLEEVDQACRRMDRDQAVLCLGLRRLWRDKVHRGAGRSSFAAWIERRTGMKTKLIELFSWVGSKLEGLPKTLDALSSGRLGYTKVREFVNLATPADEEEWIRYACTHSNREIEERVSRAERGDGTSTKKVVSRMTGTDLKAAQKARQKLSKVKGTTIPTSDLFGELAKAVANGELVPKAEVAAGNGGAPSPKLPGSYVAIQPCPICLEVLVRVPGGLLREPLGKMVQAIRSGAEVVDLTDHYLCDCEGDRHRKDLCPNWRLPEGEPATSRYVPQNELQKIRARDGGVCGEPGCLHELYMENGHLERTFIEGAPMRAEFLRTQCRTTNELIQSGAIKVVGMAPYERYYSKSGDFLGYGYDPRPRTKEDSVSHVGGGVPGAGEAPSGAKRPPPAVE